MTTKNTPFGTEATIEQVADQLTRFSLGQGDGAFVAPTAYDTAVLVTRKAHERGYLYQVDALVNTKVVKVGGRYETDGINNTPDPNSYGFSDNFTVIACFEDAAVVIEVDPLEEDLYEREKIVYAFENYAYTNLYSQVELTDL